MADTSVNMIILGIVLLILVALIVLALTVGNVGKKLASSGIQQVQNGANQFLDSQFDSYDQQKVSGQDVITALKVFQDQDKAVVVLTQGEIKMQSSAYDAGTVYNALNYNAVLTSGANPAPNAAQTSASAGNVVEVRIQGQDNAQEPGSINDGAILTKYAGNSYYTGALKTDNNGNIVYNLNTKPISISGKPSNIRQSAKFQAELIKDTSGTKIGIAFTQIQ